MKSATVPPAQSYVGPPFDEAKVHDAMRIGVVTCRPSTSLSDVSRMIQTRVALAEALPPQASTANPVDVLGDSTPER